MRQSTVDANKQGGRTKMQDREARRHIVALARELGYEAKFDDGGVHYRVFAWDVPPLWKRLSRLEAIVSALCERLGVEAKDVARPEFVKLVDRADREQTTARN
jgi:hypothetical protein